MGLPCRFWRIDLLLGAAAGVEREELVRAVDRKATDLRADGIGARVGLPMAAIPSPPYDLVLSIGSDAVRLDGLADRLRHLGEQLDGTFHPKRSALVAGHVEVLIPGDGPVFSLYPVSRAPGVTHERFHEHWTTKHVDLARAVPGLTGYRQLRGDVEATVGAAAIAGITGTRFVGAGEARRAADRPALARGAELEALLADERSFVDVAHTRPTLYQAISGADSFGG